MLRLTPGPAEARFGITAAPMSAIADWQGRVTVRRIPLRGDIAAACRRLTEAERNFDRRAASRPLHPVPDWAAKLVAPEGTRAADPGQNAVIKRLYWTEENKRKAQKLVAISRELGAQVKICVSKHARIGIDVDKPSDLELAEQMLQG